MVNDVWAEPKACITIYYIILYDIGLVEAVAIQVRRAPVNIIYNVHAYKWQSPGTNNVPFTELLVEE